MEQKKAGRKKGLSSVKVIVENKPKVVSPNLQKGRRASTKRNEEGLNEYEESFVDHYSICWNASEAARNAYGKDLKSPGSIGHELYNRPHVKAAIEKRKAEFHESMREMKTRLVQAYADVAFSDISDYIDLVEVEVVKNGKVTKEIMPKFKTTNALAQGAGKLIESIKIGRDMRIEIKLESRADAKLQLAKHIGFFEADNEQKKTNAVEVYIPDNNRGDVIISADNEKEK